MEIYLDNSATTRVSDEAFTAEREAMRVCYGNPSALHEKGGAAKAMLEKARAQVSALLGASPAEVFFSHAGTVANNTAIFGAVKARRKRGNRIVTTAAEHPSVARCMDWSAIRAEPGFEPHRPSSSMMTPSSGMRTILALSSSSSPQDQTSLKDGNSSMPASASESEEMPRDVSNLFLRSPDSTALLNAEALRIAKSKKSTGGSTMARRQPVMQPKKNFPPPLFSRCGVGHTTSA